MSGQQKKFVRSQDHLAVWSPEAKGRVYSLQETLSAFGETIVEKVLEQGVVAIVKSPEEPSLTIKSRRESLGVSLEDLAIYTGLRVEIIKKAEDKNSVSAIRDIEKICMALNIDEKTVGYAPPTPSSSNASLRFKELSEARTIAKSAKKTNIKLMLSEALWVMSKTDSMLNGEELTQKSQLSKWCTASLTKIRAQYDRPHDQGRQLAREFRNFLGMSSTQSVSSTLDVWETSIKTHVINANLPDPIGAVTIYTSIGKGIIINRKPSISAKTRRFASAHEMCHFLFDSKDDNFYTMLDLQNIEQNSKDLNSIDDNEKRANSFAIEFLCPYNSIRFIKSSMLSSGKIDKEITVDNLAKLCVNASNEYGVSISSIVSHVLNCLNHSHSELYKPVLEKCREMIRKDAKNNSSDWDIRELGYRTFLSDRVKDTRIGLFTKLVLRYMQDGAISSDTAESQLGLTANKPSEIIPYVLG